MHTSQYSPECPITYYTTIKTLPLFVHLEIYAETDAVLCRLSSSNIVDRRCASSGRGVGGTLFLGPAIGRGTACVLRSLLSIAILFVH